jgi:hypothetical protein
MRQGGLLQMNEFDALLKEYRNLVVQVSEERGYLEHLESELRDTERRLKQLAEKPKPYDISSFSMTWTPPEDFHVVESVLNADAPTPKPASSDQGTLSALEATVRAVAELGRSVSAKQLADHLGITRDAARLRLQRAAREGLIGRIGVGRYRTVNKVPKANGKGNEKQTAQAEQPEPSGGTGEKVG